MQYEIVTKPQIRLVGLKKSFCCINNEQQTHIPKMWDELFQNGQANQIEALINQTPAGLVGACLMTDDTTVDYYIAAATDLPVPSGFDEIILEESKWVVFKAVGALPTSVHNGFAYIYGQWFQTSGYEHGNNADLEVYLEGDPTKDDYVTELWIAIQ